MKTHKNIKFMVNSPAVIRAFRRWGQTCLFGAIVAFPISVFAQTNLLLIDHLWSDSVTGPWTKPPPNQTYVQPDGSLLALTTGGQKYFRLTIQETSLNDIESPAVPVEKLMSETVSIAEHHLQWLVSHFFDFGSEAPDGNAWTNAHLGPIAFKVFDPSFRNGDEPAYVEFKIVSGYQPAEQPVRFLEDNEVSPPCDLGFILVSLQDGDAPVPEFNTQGSSPCEDLLHRVGHMSGIKIMRYGPSFMAVENERGELLANAGTDPFRIPKEYLKYADQTFSNQFDSETAADLPPDGWGGPKVEATPYDSYAAFKQDYLENPFYQELRARKRRMVEDEWTLVRGGSVARPAEFLVSTVDPTLVLSNQIVTRFFLDDDEGEDIPLAQISPVATGGLLIRGGRAGAAFLTVETSAGVEKYWLKVDDPKTGLTASTSGNGGGSDFTPGWQTPLIWNGAGGWGEQVRYYQTKDYNRWCSKVGCGPVAWAMLLAWWDRHGVPAAFYSSLPGDWDISDAPKYISEAPSKIHAVYDDLHDYCDVICSPTGAGATLPGDMVEGGLPYLWVPKIFNKLSYSYAYSWDLLDPDWNEPSNLVRSSIKKGRPAILGLGWLWHYVVAYAYRYQEYKVTPEIGPLAVRRWFRCNQGWGKSSGAWYSGADTFLGMTIHPRQK
jgi:hypothetical protein